MAFQKVILPSEISTGSNRGLCYDTYKMYLFGGFNGIEYDETMMIFDFKKNEAERFVELSVSNRPSKRHCHYMDMILQNYIIIYGGTYKDQIFDDTYLFNILTYNWEKLEASEISPGRRYGMCGAKIGNICYIFGGFGGKDQNFEDVWSFDYRSREWSLFNTFGDDRVRGVDWRCVAVKLKFYCLGSNMKKLNVLEIQTREWKSLQLSGSIPAKLERFSLTITDSGLIYLFGGVSFEGPSSVIYSLDDLEGNLIWHKLECTGNIPPARCNHSAISIGEVILFVGGQADSSYFNDLFGFNSKLGLQWISFVSHGCIPADRVGHVSSYIPKLNSILIHGGDSYGQASSDLYLFDYTSHEWTKLDSRESPKLAYHTCVLDELRERVIFYGGGDMKNCSSNIYALKIGQSDFVHLRPKKSIPPRAGHNAVLHPDQTKMIVFGGFIPEEGYTNELWSLDLDDIKWTEIKSTSVSDFPVGRIAASFTVYKNSGFLIGGVNSGITLNEIWKLDLAQWLWEKITIYENTPGGIFGHCGNLVDDSIFILTGESTDSEGKLISTPANATLWSLKVKGQAEWSKFKVQGNIPPKRFYSAVRVSNDIIIYGGGKDSNMYQLDRNDVREDAESKDFFNDFILPFTEIKINPKIKKKKAAVKEEEKEDQFMIFGGLNNKSTLSSKSSRSTKSSKLDSSSQKAALIHRKS